MTEQRWRVIADRDKGDVVDHFEWDAQRGDRVVWEVVNDIAEAEIVRVERPVPSVCTCSPIATSQEPEPDEHCPDHGRSAKVLWAPTREQIAQAWMSHLGYSAVDVRDAAERGHVGARCEWDWNHQAWECQDENGKSYHPAYDDLVTAYSMADVVCEMFEAGGADAG